jgi:hypothetical protein
LVAPGKCVCPRGRGTYLAKGLTSTLAWTRNADACGVRPTARAAANAGAGSAVVYRCTCRLCPIGTTSPGGLAPAVAACAVPLSLAPRAFGLALLATNACSDAYGATLAALAAASLRTRTGLTANTVRVTFVQCDARSAPLSTYILGVKYEGTADAQNKLVAASGAPPCAAFPSAAAGGKDICVAYSEATRCVFCVCVYVCV